MRRNHGTLSSIFAPQKTPTKWDAEESCVTHFTKIAIVPHRRRLARHQRPERHAHRGVRHDGVPVLHVEPIRARLRQLRVVLQELEQDDDEVVNPRPETQHRGHEQKQKRKFVQKGRLTKEKNEEGTFYYRNISGEGIIFITVLNKIKKIAAGENYSHYSFILIRKQ